MAIILSAAWFPGSANSIAPVIQRLRNEGQHQVVLIADKHAKNKFIKDGISFSTIDDFGVSDTSVESMGIVLDKVKPDLVFVGASMQTQGNKNVIEQMLVLAARRKGIKTLSVLDLWGEYVERYSDIYTNERFKYLPDIIAVPDEFAKQEMTNLGFEAQRLVVTGNPGFDSLVERRYSYAQGDRRAWREARGIPINACMITYASQPIDIHEEFDYGFTQYTVLQELMHAIESTNQEILLFVKVHPREQIEKMKACVAGKSFSIIVDQSSDPRDVILASDIVVAPFSTMLVEACALGIPAISLQPGLKRDDIMATNKMGVTMAIYLEGGMKQALHDYFFDPNFRKDLLRNQSKLSFDSHATDRVVTLVCDQIE